VPIQLSFKVFLIGEIGSWEGMEYALAKNGTWLAKKGWCHDRRQPREWT